MPDDLERLLTELPEPPVPASLSAAVMARIARQPGPVSAAAPVASRATWRDRASWVSALAGLVLVVGLTAQEWMSGASGAAWPFIPGGRPALSLAEVPTLPLVSGVCLFLIGLFAPLRREKRM